MMTNAVAGMGCGGGSAGFVDVGVGAGVVALSLHDNASMAHPAVAMSRGNVLIVVILGLWHSRESMCSRSGRSRDQ
jgi:hypothetical protein